MKLLKRLTFKEFYRDTMENDATAEMIPLYSKQ
jgi:hypothetical protein